jgi:2-phosphosulfolactate phosphatase
MKINVILSPANVEEINFTNKNTIVIDVLRATSTIVTALMNGAKEIIPVNSVEFAMKASTSMFGGQTLLAGERNTKKIDGFNLGNSPLEFTSENINGKAIILFTTNGSKAVVKAKYSKNLWIASFLNLSSISNHLIELNEDVEILCSGRNQVFSLEDTICAGKIILEMQNIKEDIELTDSSKAATRLAKSLGKNIKKMLMESEHGKILIENGFVDDIDYCAKLNLTDIIPFYNNNSIKALNFNTLDD